MYTPTQNDLDLLRAEAQRAAAFHGGTIPLDPNRLLAVLDFVESLEDSAEEAREATERAERAEEQLEAAREEIADLELEIANLRDELEGVAA